MEKVCKNSMRALIIKIILFPTNSSMFASCYHYIFHILNLRICRAIRDLEHIILNEGEKIASKECAIGN